jgi:formylglycine-generating enzyme required for sulfatase activity
MPKTRYATDRLTVLCLLVLCCSSPATGDATAPATPALRPIPAGTYLMGDASAGGSADEQPAHTVHIEAFELGTYEVTVGEYRRFTEAAGYRTDAEKNSGGRAGCAILDVGVAMPAYREGTSWRSPGFAQTEEHPVVCLSYADVEAYIDWLKRESGQAWRLPTEAEWEYAARAGSTTAFPWGDSATDACRYANGADLTPTPNGASWPLKLDCSDGAIYTAPVGHYAANPWGLHDMIGNAWEWTADCYAPGYTQAPDDGSAVTLPACPKRSIRGGGWPYPASFLRVTNRGGSAATLRANDRGFRLAR